jgi:glycosyltransferase involved in cell wall biosynthesis
VRIAIDARELAGRPTGVGRFLREILIAWAQLPDALSHEYVLCAASAIDLSPFAPLPVSAMVREGGGTGWEQLVLPGMLREAAADVLLAPGYTAPLRSPVPFVVVVHDVSFAAHPEWFSWREGARRRTLTRLAARRARTVVTVSEFSKREIVAHLGVDANKVAVVYHGLPQVVGGAHPPIPTPQSVLYVGSVFNRRHVPELIEAFGALAAAHPDATLDIVGDNRTSPRIDIAGCAERSGAADRIHVRSYVEDAELSRLYAEAGAFAFLSEYEGFGLTPLEALGSGVPIVVLDTAVAREVYQDAALYVARPEPHVIANALERALYDADERARVLAASSELLPRYSWDRAARRLLAALTGGRA